MRFSQRIGISPIRLELQVTSMDDALKNKLWNIFSRKLFYNAFQYTGLMSPRTPNDNFYRKLETIWHNFLNKTVDSIPSTEENVISIIKHMFFSNDWYFVYDIIEFSLKLDTETDLKTISAYNSVLESEKSAYRIVGNLFLKLTDDKEIENVNYVLEIGVPYDTAKKHIETSIALLSNRTNPDYRNSIKESISAIEATCNIITNSSTDTLGKALNKLEQKNGLHRALKAGFSALYGYSSDADGIRHAMMDIPNIEYSDAIYFLVTCSAFVNYLIAKSEK
jgi:hypothetical protein